MRPEELGLAKTAGSRCGSVGGFELMKERERFIFVFEGGVEKCILVLTEMHPKKPLGAVGRAV